MNIKQNLKNIIELLNSLCYNNHEKGEKIEETTNYRKTISSNGICKGFEVRK